ncbi:hypothetical protein [Bat SARS coronavirus HKU3-8]|uniref:Uncharacterized protein n=2 Tax=Bat coronavirus HKU3 TaxID=442736 RepID=D5HJV3_BCHK3|nr:hypothetical protein [Bat SARS coronavirus HKU3-8]
MSNTLLFGLVYKNWIYVKVIMDEEFQFIMRCLAITLSLVNH